MDIFDVAVDNKSFERAGITKDCHEAICEYIWNGFEANATQVIVEITGEQLVSPYQVSISDNGTGINYETLKLTFGSFLSSIKPSSSIRIKSQINKGKGRYSYFALSSSALWDTVYVENGSKKRYTIQLNSSNKARVSASRPIIANESSIGTIVTIPISDKKILSQILFGDMHIKLLEEFAWFLYLNKNRNVKLIYCGNELNYKEYINHELSNHLDINILDQKFLIDIIVWRSRVDNCSKIYYMDINGELKYVENTSFNKNAVDFYHAVFVRSSFFSDGIPIFLGDEDSIVDIEMNTKKKTMRALKKQIHSIVNNTLREFLLKKADTYLQNMEKKNNYPKFSNDEFGFARRKDFERVTKELYCIEPRIFYKLRDQQVRSLLGFISLLLDSKERENVLTVVEQVTSLTPEQREKLAKVLKRSRLENIIELADIIQQRYEVVQKLKSIVFDYTKFANERDHIQKIVENHYWLFGDQYQLVTADRTIKKSLEKFEYIISANSDKNSPLSLSKEEQKQRLDLFLYGGRITENGEKECLVIELKAPSISLSLDVYNQIERYAYAILKEPKFQSKDRLWRFFAVCTTVDDEVKVKYANFLDKGKKCLAGIVSSFDIYAMSWDDIFTSFELRYGALLEKLRQDFEESEINGDEEPSRELVRKKVESVLQMRLVN